MPNNIILDEASSISEAQWAAIIQDYNREREEYRRIRERQQEEETTRRRVDSYMYQLFAAGIGSHQYIINQAYYGVGVTGVGEWRSSESKPKAKKESKIPWL